MTTHSTTRRWPLGPLALGAGILLALAGLTTVPGGTAADKEPALPVPLPADLKLVPPDAIFFVTVRLGDLKKPLADKALNLFSADEGRNVREGLKRLLLPPEAIERATVVLPAPGKEFAPQAVLIVRTAKAYDKEKLLRAFSASATETKYRRRTYHVRSGKRGPAEAALYLLDERTFLHGPVGMLGALLGRREGKAEEDKGPLAAARRLTAGKHHVVAAVRPDVLVSTWLSPVLFAGEAPQPNALRLDRMRPGEALPLLPFMPLIRASAAVFTLDAGPELKVGVRVHCRSAEDAEDAETSLRSTLYVVRELLGAWMREVGIDLKGKGAMADVLRGVEGPLRGAVVERDKATVRVALSCKIGPATLTRAFAEVEHLANDVRSANNLKQIALALMNAHDTYNAFPAAAICDAKGKPLLSWRVAILPFIEEDDLYKRFNFAEAWDSPTNKKLLARMPRTYAPPPGVKTKQPHSTFYRIFVGKEAGFLPGERATFVSPQPRPSQGRRIREITDGASNTLAVVEAGEAVPWTKPDDLPYDPKGPLPKLGGAFREGFHAAFFDGSVRYIKNGVDEKTLRALITPAGNEVIDWKKVPLVRPVVGASPRIELPRPAPGELPPKKL